MAKGGFWTSAASSRRGRGRLGGRPRKLADAKQLELARNLYEGGQTDVATICRTLGVSRATLYRALEEAPKKPATPSRARSVR